MNYISVLLFLSIFLSSTVLAAGNKNQQVSSLLDGGKLLESNCLSCHSPTLSKENRIAPPMIAIKQHYLRENATLDEFVVAFSAFVMNPDPAISKMPRAVKKYGIMPKLHINEAKLEAIANHIYNTPLKGKNWSNKSHLDEANLQVKEEQKAISFLDAGQEYANSAKSILGKNLKQAIHNKGTIGALAFCNENAIDLTESSAPNKLVSIRRVSDLTRNPSNSASPQELQYILEAKRLLKNKQTILPKVSKNENSNVGYYPILTNQMCLQCHGVVNQDIKPDTHKTIGQLYPKDQAVGYQANELRGIWVIQKSN